MIDRTKDVGRLNLKTGTVDMTHGAGGLASVQLIEAVFAKHFTNEWLNVGHDGALLPPISKPVAVSCDAHVVSPLFFLQGAISVDWLLPVLSMMFRCVGRSLCTSPHRSFWKRVFR